MVVVDALRGEAGWPCDGVGSTSAAWHKKHSAPQSTPREYRDGRGWYVEAASEDGVAENVENFPQIPKPRIGLLENR